MWLQAMAHLPQVLVRKKRAAAQLVLLPQVLVRSNRRRTCRSISRIRAYMPVYLSGRMEPKTKMEPVVAKVSSNPSRHR